jgi:hypothetical protein
MMREFGIGYAPGNVRELLDQLSELGYSDDELVAAGIATQSDRGHIHVVFHARVMFPIRGADRRPVGFAGLATHLGPSWSLWVASPRSELFRPDRAFFGLDRALPAIAQERRALIKRDCAEVMRLHQEGYEEAVGVIKNPITGRHLALLADPLGVDATDLSVVRNRRLDSVVVQPAGSEIEPEAFGPRHRPRGFGLAAATTGSGWDHTGERTPVLLGREAPQGPRAIVYMGGILVGAGIPLGTLLVLAPGTSGPGGATPALNVVIAAVAASYIVLTVAISRVSAKRRTRSRSRRMRLPWARGSGEVQPRGWTYHPLEEVLAGAALVSALICIALWMTIGGFFG